MKRNQSIIISYMQLRTLIGFLGMSLPVLCYLWCIAFNNAIVLDSLSKHYFTEFRDLFVGVMICVSFFLVTYKGYDILDNIVTVAIGVFGMGIALFPCEYTDVTRKVSIFLLDNKVTHIIHCVCAAAFFALLAFNSIFLFTKSRRPVHKGSRKYYRNIVYIVCRVLMVVPLLALAVVSIIDNQEFNDRTHIILILETMMLVSFGVSWLVKGGALIRDKKPHHVPA